MIVACFPLIRIDALENEAISIETILTESTILDKRMKVSYDQTYIDCLVNLFSGLGLLVHL